MIGRLVSETPAAGQKRVYRFEVDQWVKGPTAPEVEVNAVSLTDLGGRTLEPDLAVGVLASTGYALAPVSTSRRDIALLLGMRHRLLAALLGVALVIAHGENITDFQHLKIDGIVHFENINWQADNGFVVKSSVAFRGLNREIKFITGRQSSKMMFETSDKVSCTKQEYERMFCVCGFYMLF